MSQVENNNISTLIEKSLQNLRTLVDANTIVGAPIQAGETTIIPVSKVSFGFASGGSDIPTAKPGAPFGGGSGGGVSVQPIAFLVVQSDGGVQLLPVNEESNSVDKLIQSAPQLFDKISGFMNKKKADKEAKAAEKAEKAAAEEESSDEEYRF